jgi:hypothetical protein
VPNWDEDSPQLRENLAQVLAEIVRSASQREIPTLEAARRWQTLMMKSLDVPDARFVGAFRGESGLETVQVRVDSNFGVDSAEVAAELTRFEEKLQRLVAELDTLLPVGHEPNVDELAAIIDLCAWAHAEWVRIHPFAMVAVAPRAFGRIASRCDMACLHSFVCARDPMEATGKLELTRCEGIGNRPPLCSDAYLMIF